MKKAFIKSYFIFSLIVFLVSLPIIYILLPETIRMGAIINVIFFFILTFIMGMILIISLEKNAQQAYITVLSTVFVKMIVAVVFFLMVFRQFKTHLILFAFSYFVSYLIFTTFEVAFIVRNLNKMQ